MGYSLVIGHIQDEISFMNPINSFTHYGFVNNDSDRVESCTYQVPYYVTVCRRRGRGNRRVCHREVRYRTIYGRRNVTFFIQHTDRNISVRFLDLDSTNQVGNFEGTYNTNRKIYTYEGRCR
jgi:hypothetical protein